MGTPITVLLVYNPYETVFVALPAPECAYDGIVGRNLCRSTSFHTVVWLKNHFIIVFERNEPARLSMLSN